jgi:alkanesulfonate monooxygenase SsuD/methylene tetrahydromethanopterin reductase-like flavin-dependent oxidoreductase (luciferase family)
LIESIDFIQQIWSQDPPYDLDGKFWSVKVKDAIMPDLGIGYMSKPYQKPHPPISLSIASPHSSSCRLAAERDWGIISANISPTYSVASHWDIYCEASESAGRRAVGDDWRVARNLLVAPSDLEAEDRMSHKSSSNDYYFTYMHGVFASLGILILVKPDPNMSDEETTPAVITDELVIYGSPKTVIDKLVAFRDRVGPFGTLLMTGVDWSGPNEAWEKQSMKLLADEVMPKFRQHVLATAAQ